MMSAKRLARLVKKWQRATALGRKRLVWSSSTPEKEITEGSCSTSYSSMAGKGHVSCTQLTACGSKCRLRFSARRSSLSFYGCPTRVRLHRQQWQDHAALRCRADGVRHVLAREKCLCRDGGCVPQVHGDAITMPLRCKLRGATSGSWPACCCLQLLIDICFSTSVCNVVRCRKTGKRKLFM